MGGWALSKTQRPPHPNGGASARADVGVCTVRVSGPAVAAGNPTRCARPPSGAGRRTHRVGNGARVDVDCGPGPTRPRPGHLSAGPRSRGTGRNRAHRTTRPGARSSATRRHGLQGIVTGGERSLHRDPGDRPSHGDLLRPCGSTPRRRRSRGPNRQGDDHRSRAAVRRLPGHDVPDSSAATAVPNRPCRWRCSGCCTNAPAYWPTIRPDGPRSTSRPTSFWRTPPVRPRKQPDLHARRRRHGRSAAAGFTASPRAAREIADPTLSYFELRK